MLTATDPTRGVMKKSRRQLEEERLAEEEQRAQRKERRRRAREALERDELADEVAAGSAGAAAAAVALRARGGFFEEERQGMEEVDLGPGASLSLPGAPSAPLYSWRFLRRFAAVAALGVALTCGAASSWRRNNPLPRFELGSSSLVAIRSLDSSKAYLQLSTQDGLLRASATSKDEVGAVVTTHYSLLTTHHSLLITHYSLPTYCLLPTTYYRWARSSACLCSAVPRFVRSGLRRRRARLSLRSMSTRDGPSA